MSAFLISLFHGALIGGVNVLPGLSGGAVSVSLGEFDRILLRINGLAADRPNRRLHLLNLVPLVAGMTVGLLLCCRLVAFLLTACPFPATGALCGVLLGSIPLFIRNANFRQGMGPANLLWLMLGAGLVLVIQLSKSSLDVQNASYRFFDGLALFAGTALSTACMVIPGFSGASMLLLLGQYRVAVTALATLDLLRLIPMGLGAATGLLIIAKLLSALLKTRYSTVYWAILGMSCGWLTGAGVDLARFIRRANVDMILLSGVAFLLGGLMALLAQRPKKLAQPQLAADEDGFEKVL